MPSDEAEITITYRPDDQNAKIKCDYPGEDPDNRDERVERLFKSIYHAAGEHFDEEDMTTLGGGEVDDNAVIHGFGTEEDIKMG